jgi:hypothetical protein
MPSCPTYQTNIDRALEYTPPYTPINRYIPYVHAMENWGRR